MSSETALPQVSDSCWLKLEKFVVQRRFIDDDYYETGNKLCQSVLGKKSIVIHDSEDFLHQHTETFRCHVPACMKVFKTLITFEDHYNTHHRYVCETCHKHLPSPHLLDLHITETHDSYFAALAERKPMFQCFVECCNLKFSNKKERRSHCIEVHKYPPDFRYDSSKRIEKKITQTDSSASILKPGKIFRFGHCSNRGFFRHRGRGGFHRADRKSENITEDQEVLMTDLEEALPSME